MGIGCEWAQGPPEIGSAEVPLTRGAGQASCDDLERKNLGKGAWGRTLISGIQNEKCSGLQGPGGAAIRQTLR